jgi:hypothetical protein
LPPAARGGEKIVNSTVVGLIAAAATIIAAVISGIITSRITKKNAELKYKRDRLDETYRQLLGGVHLREAQIQNSLERECDAPSPTAASQYDPTTADETEFGARMLLYASPEVKQLWQSFVQETATLDTFLDAIRQTARMAPGKYMKSVSEELKALVSVDPLEEHMKAWSEILTLLQAQIQTDLDHPEKVGKVHHHRLPPVGQDMTPTELRPYDRPVRVTSEDDSEAPEAGTMPDDAASPP